jgi:hypothetical protein
MPNPAEFVQMWPTLTAFDWNTAVKNRTEPGSGTYHHNLKEAVQLWPTPKARDYRSGDDPEGPRAKRKQEEGWSLDLNDAVKLFPTPVASDWKHHGPESKQQGLADVAGNFPTPTASMMTLQDMEQARFAGNDPRRSKYQEAFPTPTANDARNSLTESQRGRGTLTARLVETESEISGQLNPDWEEALMGFPPGWTNLED